MRIDDANRVGYENYDRLKPASQSANPAKTQTNKNEALSTSRADKLAQLKQAFQSNRPIDVNQLAETLLKTGIFFDEKA
ncbi:MAG: hypothetical protein K6T83_01710 [Alicyclobacillus sp.]|nr:hypothetical protein [Alicyclobacillus sp.]